MEISDAQTFLRDNHHGVLVAWKKDGSADDPGFAGDDAEGKVIITARDSTYKVKNIKRDPGSLYWFTGTSLTALITFRSTAKPRSSNTPGPDIVLDWHRKIRGVPDNWDDIRKKTLSEGRIAIRVTIENAGPQSRG